MVQGKSIGGCSGRGEEVGGGQGRGDGRGGEVYVCVYNRATNRAITDERVSIKDEVSRRPLPHRQQRPECEGSTHTHTQSDIDTCDE